MTTPENLRKSERLLAEALFSGFVKCPTTGRVIEVLEGDDKVLCTCRRSNPQVPEERTHLTSTHMVRFCETATTDEWLDQREQDREADRG